MRMVLRLLPSAGDGSGEEAGIGAGTGTVVKIAGRSEESSPRPLHRPNKKSACTARPAWSKAMLYAPSNPNPRSRSQAITSTAAWPASAYLGRSASARCRSAAATTSRRAPTHASTPCRRARPPRRHAGSRGHYVQTRGETPRQLRQPALRPVSPDDAQALSRVSPVPEVAWSCRFHNGRRH